MGANHSKQAKNANGRTDSPNEKHNSADSQAPLAKHAANFGLPRNSSIERHRSITISDPGLEIAQTPNHAENDTEPAVTPSTSPTTPQTQLDVSIDDLEGHSNVSRPPPPPSLRRLSELIDPADLPMDYHIRSPSGNLLAPEQYLVRADRPRSIRERQEEIREKVRAASRLGVEVRKSDDEMPMPMPIVSKEGKVGANGGKKARRKCLGCWCFSAA